ncbi:unnamed protein product, partial [marine sediment metagenome]
WLEQVNECYDLELDDDSRPVLGDSLLCWNPATDFWLQTELAEKALKKMLCKLQRVEPLAPKRMRKKLETFQALVTAIGRHEPLANDPAVIDAVNAVEDALRQGEAR